MGDASICPADLFGVPASAYFLWVVHRLYRQALVDWNRRPIIGAPQATVRPGPWRSAIALELHTAHASDLLGAVTAAESAA